MQRAYSAQDALLVYPHQLFRLALWREHSPQAGRAYVIEEPLLFTQYAFHLQKLVFHRASLRRYAESLARSGWEVRYVESDEIARTEDIARILRRDGIKRAFAFDPVDDWLETRLSAALRDTGIALQIGETPAFLTDRVALQDYLSGRKPDARLSMAHFYRWQRRRLGILVDEDGEPVGGRWSFDVDNRKRLPGGIAVPPPFRAQADEYVIEAIAYVRERFPGNPGSLEGFRYATSAEEARRALARFLDASLDSFGPYEDAISSRHDTLFHSALSPYLNAGLLTPGEVVDAVLARHAARPVPLPSLEGFIRQVIGWREYVRLAYVRDGRRMRTRNFLGHRRTLPTSFWTGETGILPVDETIRGVLASAYAHHIPRLMILGSFMNLCDIEPGDAYRWFMELFIDAYDWVMVPNVYAMALYADGGTMTTKPYVSGSRYLRAMSDYLPDGRWEKVWDALFWTFVGRHRQAFAGNLRASLMAVQYDRMTPETRAAHEETARAFLASL